MPFTCRGVEEEEEEEEANLWRWVMPLFPDLCPPSTSRQYSITILCTRS